MYYFYFFFLFVCGFLADTVWYLLVLIHLCFLMMIGGLFVMYSFALSLFKNCFCPDF